VTSEIHFTLKRFIVKLNKCVNSLFRTLLFSIIFALQMHFAINLESDCLDRPSFQVNHII